MGQLNQTVQPNFKSKPSSLLWSLVYAIRKLKIKLMGYVSC